MKTSIFPDSFFSLLMRNEMTFERFLKDEGSIIQIRRQNKIVTNYLIENIEKLLEYALQEESDFFSQRAMKILEQNNPKIINTICEGSEIHDFANEILNDELKQTNSTIGKLGTLLDICIKKNHGCVCNLSFLPDFLHLCDNEMIESLFETIISINKDDIKYFLRIHKFLDLILDLITKWHHGENLNRQCVVSLYKILIKQISSNREESLSPKLIQFSVDFLEEHTDDVIISMQWKLASEVLDTSNVKDFATVYPIALKAIDVSNNLNAFLEYQVNAIEFISNLINYMPSFAAQIEGKILISAITNIFIIFKESSIALSMVCSFMISVFESSELRSFIFEIFFPVIVKTCQTEGKVNQRAFALEFGRQALDIGFDDEEILTEIKNQQEFMEICVPKIRAAEEIIHKDDGNFCMCPKFVKCTSFDTLKPVPININLSV